MAVTAADIRTTYPLPVYNFRVEFGTDAIAFSEVSGLSMGFEVATYKESPTESGAAGPRTVLMPSQPTHPTVSLKKGVVRSVSYASLYTWFATTALNQVEKKDVFVRLLDEAGAPIISWKIANAFPSKLDAPTFDAKSNEVAIESMELRADRITVEPA